LLLALLAGSIPGATSVVTVACGLISVTPASNCVPSSSVIAAGLLYNTEGDAGSAVTSVPMALPRALPS